MKKLIATSAVALILGAAPSISFAQEESTQGYPAQEESTGEASGESASAEMVGKSVFDSNGQQVGTIERIATAEDGSEQAIISVGGFLGMGSKKIAIATSDLTPTADGEGYAVPLTAEEIEAAPESDQE